MSRSGVELVPAPWTLKGRSWTFLLSGLSKECNFPSAFAAPFQAEAMSSHGKFIGGLGMIMLVSYSESPVGPYDELMYIPGRWTYPNGKTGFRITNIFVSTKITTENGRLNWNVPKQVANFEILHRSDGTSTFKVTMPGASTPFFNAIVQPMSIVSSITIPYDTGILGGYFTLIQPPLPEGHDPEEVGTNKWIELIPHMKGSMHMARLVPGFEGQKVGDGKTFPAVQPWSVGTAVENLVLQFGVPVSYETMNGKNAS